MRITTHPSVLKENRSKGASPYQEIAKKNPKWAVFAHFYGISLASAAVRVNGLGGFCPSVRPLFLDEYGNLAQFVCARDASVVVLDTGVAT